MCPWGAALPQHAPRVYARTHPPTHTQCLQAHTLNGGCCRLQPVVGVRMAQYAPILQPRRHHGRTAQLSRSASADTLATVEGQRPGDWLACVEQLQAQLGCSEADAEVYVQRAFGWGARARAYWRHEKARCTACTHFTGLHVCHVQACPGSTHACMNSRRTAAQPCCAPLLALTTLSLPVAPDCTATGV